MLVARDQTGPLTIISADGEDIDADGRGHIRIFIAEQRASGRGIGQRILGMALDCLRKAGRTGAWLNTFSGLDAARSLYLKAGFRIEEEGDGMTWGTAH